jgi:hypothetical protein
VLKQDIKIIKDLIKKQEIEEAEKLESNISYGNFTPYNREKIKSKKNIKFTIKDLLKKDLTSNKKKTILSLKIINTSNNDIEKENPLLKKMKKYRNTNRINQINFRNNKTHKLDGKKLKTLITALNNSKSGLKPKISNNRILSYTEQMYHKINKKNLTDFHSYESDMIDYLKKRKYTIKETNMDNFNKEMSERIYDIKHKIKREGLSNAYIERLGDYGENAYRKYQKILHAENVIEKMDKYYAKHVIDKYFDE